MMRFVALTLIGASLALAGCGSDSASSVNPGRDYSATIVRTTYGVPHITTDNYGDLGFGVGYAYAQDNVCLLMREIVASNGQTARYFGEEEGDPSADYVYTHYNSQEMIEQGLFQGVTDDLLEALAGYAAGFNQFLEDTGVDNLPEDCRGASWVRPITQLDMGKVIRKLILRASTDNLTGAIMAADPPTQSMAKLLPQESAPLTIRNPLPPITELGSNGYGIGSNASQTEFGLQLLQRFDGQSAVPGLFDQVFSQGIDGNAPFGDHHVDKLPRSAEGGHPVPDHRDPVPEEGKRKDDRLGE